MCRRLADTPFIGREHPSYRLRSFPVRRYVIYYRVTEEQVEILRVLHERRDHSRALRRWLTRDS
jgi:toxin ParE1/3/4